MITVEQYVKAIDQLSKGNRALLEKLYYIEPAADTKEIAIQLDYKGFEGANLQIGLTGKKICEVLNIQPDLRGYLDSNEGGGYFIVIHRHYGDHWDMEPNLRKAIEIHAQLKPKKETDVITLTTEIQNAEIKKYPEGSLVSVLVNRVERNREARDAAILRHGDKCLGCGIDFQLTYGSDIKTIIEVHHINPFKNERGKRNTHPENDLVPLCPNCHAVVHSKTELMSIEELKSRVSFSASVNPTVKD